MTISSQNSKLQAALTVIKAAQGKAANKEFQPALEKYELALGALIPLLQNEVATPLTSKHFEVKGPVPYDKNSELMLCHLR